MISDDGIHDVSVMNAHENSGDASPGTDIGLELADVMASGRVVARRRWTATLVIGRSRKAPIRGEVFRLVESMPAAADPQGVDGVRKPIPAETVRISERGSQRGRGGGLLAWVGGIQDGSPEQGRRAGHAGWAWSGIELWKSPKYWAVTRCFGLFEWTLGPSICE
jgi:hypothetical protein